MKRLYIIYDGRAMANVDDATVMETCDSLKEAKEDMKDFGDGCVIYSYLKKGKELVDERFEYYDSKQP